jgi:hypothetical protein
METYARHMRLIFQPRLVEVFRDSVSPDLDGTIETVTAGSGGFTAEQLEGTVNRMGEEAFWTGRLDVHRRLAEGSEPARAVVREAMARSSEGVPNLHSALAAVVAAGQAWMASTATATDIDEEARAQLRTALARELAAAEEALAVFAGLPPLGDPDTVADAALSVALKEEVESKQRAVDETARGRATMRRPMASMNGPSHNDLRY